MRQQRSMRHYVTSGIVSFDQLHDWLSMMSVCQWQPIIWWPLMADKMVLANDIWTESRYLNVPSPMTTQRSGQYVLLADSLTLEDELSDTSTGSPIHPSEPAPLHQRFVRVRTLDSGRSRTRTDRSSTRPGRVVRTYQCRQNDGGIIERDLSDAFRTYRDDRSYTAHYSSIESEENIKCIISSVLFLVIIITVVIVAVVKNPEMWQ